MAVFADIDGDGAEDAILAWESVGVVFANQAGHWKQVGALQLLCPGDVEAMAKGGLAVKPSHKNDLEIAGRRLDIMSFENQACPGQTEVLDTELVKPPPPPNPSPSAPPASPKPPAKAPPAGR